MAVIETLTVEVEAEIKDFKTRLKNVEKSLKNLDKQGKTTSKSIQKSTKKMDDSFKDIKGAVLGAFSVGAIISFTQQLLSLGSDVEEIGSKFNTVFGGIEEETTQAFNDIADATGRSRLEMRKFAGDIGDVLKPMGLTTDEASTLSQQMIKLAIDTASFNNVTDDQAINAFKAALTGEREALKSLGIVISDADIKQKALTLGIEKSTNEMSKQEKALITWQLLLENTTDAQQDAIRTSESYANQSKRLGGIIKDTLAEAGKDVAASSSSVLKTMGDFINTYGLAIVKVVINTAGAILDVVATAASGFKSMYDVLVGNTGKVEKDQLKFTTVLLYLFNSIGQGFNTVKTILLSAGSVIGGVFAGMISGAKQVGKSIWELLKAAGNAATGNFDAAKNNLANLVEIQAAAAKEQVDIGDSVVETIGGQWKELGKDIEKSLADIDNNIKGNAEGTLKEYDASFSDLQGILDKYSQNAANSASQQKADAKATAKAVADAVKEQIQDLEALEKDGKQTYKAITAEADKNMEKIKKLVDEYHELSEKIEEVGAEGAKDIAKINAEITKLEQNLKGIQSEGASELVERQLEIQERLKDLKDEDYTSDRLKEERELKKELALINESVTEEEKIKYTAELQKSKTQKILDSIEAKKAEVQADIEAKEAEKLARETALAEELAELETLKEAKKNEALAEGEALRELIKTKNTLETAYQKAFFKRIDSEEKKVENLTKKYLALAAAKRSAGYSGSVVEAATTSIAQSQNTGFNTQQVSDIQPNQVNFYGDTTFETSPSNDEFTENINNQINP